MENIDIMDMQKFLTANGWNQRRFHWYGSLYWVDPLNFSLKNTIERAYEIAFNRKIRNDRKFLKETGWVGKKYPGVKYFMYTHKNYKKHGVEVPLLRETAIEFQLTGKIP